MLALLALVGVSSGTFHENVPVHKLHDAAATAWNVAAALQKHKAHKSHVLAGEKSGGGDGAKAAARGGGVAVGHEKDPRGLSRGTKRWLARLRHEVATLRPLLSENGGGYPFDGLAARAWAKYAAVTKGEMRKMRAADPATTAEARVEDTPVREDGSIFLSIASYRDRLGLEKRSTYRAADGVGMCAGSVLGAFRYAAHPERLFVGIVDQRCRAGCKTGVFTGGTEEETAVPDRDCAREVCAHPETARYCASGQVRFASLSEQDAMGPMMARYIASQLWRGEQYYVQIDAHSTWGDHWDRRMIKMVEDAPATHRGKAVITAYPPGSRMGDRGRSFQSQPGSRMCASAFTDPTGGEGGIVRIQASMRFEHAPPARPKFAPFVAAGFFIAPATFLREVPFDPYLPWVFMGEELLLTVRLFAAGYDIFSPTTDVIGHQYTVPGVPRFWETLGRVYGAGGCHNQLQPYVLARIKHVLGYPEQAAGKVQPASLLWEMDRYGLAGERTRDEYLKMVGIDMVRKTTRTPGWCTQGTEPANIAAGKARLSAA